MTIAEMFGQSGVLTLLGMGVVFGFLIILVLFMNLVAWIIKALRWDIDAQEGQSAQASPAAAAAGNSAAVVAAISAAVNEYRKTNQ
ncbi:MAG TPA: OadG family protein [Treponema sp.]|nr:OadG family protein [Treponema sp.]HPC71840.1 OadG family protein [Treponema sp.]HRS04296.1 OadG family protein [Treponema sp.]HRU28925.1 OadG family protein [Treponema sp.]